MAEIVCVDNLEGLMERLKEMKEPQLTGQVIAMRGALHSLQFLQAMGCTPENLEQLLDCCEINCGIAEQMLAAMGSPMEFESNIVTDETTPG